jgi:hypothetical protein
MHSVPLRGRVTGGRPSGLPPVFGHADVANFDDLGATVGDG